MARTAPVSTGTKEVYSADMPTRTLEDIGDNIEDREPEIIVTDEVKAKSDYLADLAFMEEPVTILIHKGREKHAPRVLDFYCNGKPIWVVVDTPTTVPRKYVEIIARSQPMTVSTESGEEQSDAGAYNRIIRSLYSQFPFTVIEDKNPRGHAWLAKVMRES